MTQEKYLELSDLDKLKWDVEESLKQHKGCTSQYWKGSAFMGESVLTAIEQIKEINITQTPKK